MISSSFFAYLFIAYVGIGVPVAIWFAFNGASKLANNAPVTGGARLCFIPGAIALWPLILKRWLSAGDPK